MPQDAESTLTLSLTVRRAADALEFYKVALGAEELYRMSTPDGGVAHAEFRIGNSRIFISDESELGQARAMPEGTTASCLFSLNTDDPDGDFRRAVDAGAQPITQPTDYFWGERNAIVRDPYGYRWCFAKQVEDVSPEEVERRAKAAFGG